ncbi:MAG: GSCFA domain-containing protein [Bacteroidales bacterium]
MLFRTELTLPKSEYPIGYADKLLLMGSCFSENIGTWLSEHYLDVVINPFGILYNPESLARAFDALLQERRYSESDLFEHQGLYRSFDHHSRFAAPTQAEALNLINSSCEEASRQLQQANRLLITFGTAWVYYLRKNGEAVSNCHKLPESLFDRRKMHTQEIVSRWSKLIEIMLKENQNLQLTFTVSPIRHIKDSLHGNQLSKSTLLLAIDELQGLFPDNVSYFAAYELMMDDLRDYRFYAADMTHPSDTAINYIREKFADCYFSPQTKRLFAECEKLKKALDHKPSDYKSESYKRFLTQNIQKIEDLIEKNPYFTLRKPLLQFQQRLI